MTLIPALPPLLNWTLTLWLIGVVLAIVGHLIRRQQGIATPGWDELIRQFFSGILTAINRIANGPSLGDRLIGVGTLFLFAGILPLAVWFIQVVWPILFPPA